MTPSRLREYLEQLESLTDNAYTFYSQTAWTRGRLKELVEDMLRELDESEETPPSAPSERLEGPSVSEHS